MSLVRTNGVLSAPTADFITNYKSSDEDTRFYIELELDQRLAEMITSGLITKDLIEGLDLRKKHIVYSQRYNNYKIHSDASAVFTSIKVGAKVIDSFLQGILNISVPMVTNAITCCENIIMEQLLEASRAGSLNMSTLGKSCLNFIEKFSPRMRIIFVVGAAAACSVVGNIIAPEFADIMLEMFVGTLGNRGEGPKEVSLIGDGMKMLSNYGLLPTSSKRVESTTEPAKICEDTTSTFVLPFD